MFTTRITLAACSVLLVAACASEPRGALLDKKFERTAATFQKYDVKGQTWYCKKGEPASFTRLPGWQCLTEEQLRENVASFERGRNAVAYNRNITKGG